MIYDAPTGPLPKSMDEMLGAFFLHQYIFTTTVRGKAHNETILQRFQRWKSIFCLDVIQFELYITYDDFTMEVFFKFLFKSTDVNVM